MATSHLNGLLLVDKPSGITSHDVVARLRKILKTKEVGHSGTLDPLASGLMVCLINEGTKLSQFVLEKNKEYILTLKLGVKSDTYDSEGQVEATNISIPSEERVIEEAEKLQGELLLPVPIYSAAKVNGKKLYEYARNGEEVIIPQKIMKFWNLNILKDQSVEFPHMRFSITCSKGSFIRAWVHKLGEILGCGAILVELRRTKSSFFTLDHALKLDSIEGIDDLIKKPLAFIPLSHALRDVKSVSVQGRDLNFIKNGQISYELRGRLISLFNPETDQYIQIIDQKSGNLLAVIALDTQRGLFIKRVFH